MIVTTVPPAGGPDDGEIDVTTGTLGTDAVDHDWLLDVQENAVPLL